MRQFLIALLAAACAAPALHATLTLDSILDRWLTLPSYAARATFAVSMPQMPDDVVYTLDLASERAAATDTLLPVSYLIEWTLPAETRPTEGFSAYFGGNHFRYAGGEKLQEYHLESDPAPFATRGTGSRRTAGVHRTAQFASLLPALMALELKEQMTNDAYSLRFIPDTLADGARRPAIVVRLTVDGVACQEGEYLLDAATLLPQRVTFENNPGSISEQTIVTLYGAPDAERLPDAPISEELLIRRHPQVFGKFRRSTFRTESLVGHPLPGFALPTLTGERYARSTGDAFRAPTVIAIVDPDTGFSSETVAAVRRAADRLPYSPDIIFAATSSNTDSVEELLGALRPGEHHLISAQPLARDCGVSTTPVVIVASAAGNVAFVVTGYTPSLEEDLVNNMCAPGVLQ